MSVTFAMACLLSVAPAGTTAANQHAGGKHRTSPERFDPYVITPLGTEAAAIDAQGRVAVNQGTLAYRFVPASPNSPTGTLAPLGTVGEAYLPGNAQAHACLWAGGTGQDLGDLGDHYSEALAISPDGSRIVGRATVPNGTGFLVYHAFLHEDGAMVDLNTRLPPGSGWVLDGASGVNDRGQIVGSGMLGGQQRGFLLTPRGELRRWRTRHPGPSPRGLESPGTRAHREEGSP